MEVSVVIPAYNEARRIENALDQIATYFEEKGVEWEIVVADDGSEDETAEIVRRWAKQNGHRGSRLRLLTLSHQGKGAAVAAGFAAATGRYVLMSDADLSTPIPDWEKLRAVLERGAVIAAGSRQAAGAVVGKHQPWFRQRLGLWFGALVRRFFPVGVIDSQCGFKGFRREEAQEIFRDLQSKGFCFDVELLARARQRGLSVIEVPVRWDNHPESKVRVWRDWPRVLLELGRIWRALRREEKTKAGKR